MKDKTNTYQKVKFFLRKYPMTIAWRIKKHSYLIDKYLNKGEVVKYAFVAQENDNPVDIITTCVVALTNKRILIARKRFLWGYFYHSITPDMFNDLEIKTGLIWGKLYIDTIKETVKLSNMDKRALAEVEEQVSETIMLLKQEYALKRSL